MPMLNWAVAEVTDPITNHNASSPLRSTCLVFMLSVRHRHQDIPDEPFEIGVAGCQEPLSTGATGEL